MEMVVFDEKERVSNICTEINQFKHAYSLLKLERINDPNELDDRHVITSYTLNKLNFLNLT